MSSIYEDVVSRDGNSREVTRVYVATDYATEDLAIAAAHSFAPTSIGDRDRLDDETAAREFHQDHWRITVRWKLFEPTTGDNYSFEIGGSSIHRTHSISTVSSYANTGETVPEMKNAINWDGNPNGTGGRINGVQLPPEPGFTFTIPARKATADVDHAYIDAVSDLLYTVNDATFEGFAAGEVLFLGVNGSRTGDDFWQLYFRFAREPNETGLSVDTITSIAKEGWEYLWVYTEPHEDTTANVLTTKPKAVYVEQVFNDGSFSGLEL